MFIYDVLEKVWPPNASDGYRELALMLSCKSSGLVDYCSNALAGAAVTLNYVKPLAAQPWQCLPETHQLLVRKQRANL